MIPKVVLIALTALLLSACTRPTISGTVVNLQGEGLPGVVVRLKDSPESTLTDAVGDYKIRFRPGTVTLEYNKTGYTPGELRIDIDKPRRIEATAVALWQLPSNAGVYLFENNRYIELARGETQRYFLAEGDMAYAVTQIPKTSSQTDEPLIVCYKTPRYNARLSRLEKLEVRRSTSDSETVTAWTEAGTMRADLRPIDEAEGLLLQLELDRGLEPGDYAIHWGALEGQQALEKRVYLFRVEEPPPPPVKGPVLFGIEINLGFDRPAAADTSEAAEQLAPPPQNQ